MSPRVAMRVVGPLPLRLARATPQTREAADDEPEHEPADVPPPRDPAAGARGERQGAAEELEHEPETEIEDRRDRDDLEEEEDRQQRDDAGVRVHHDVGAEHAGDRAAGADGGDGRARLQRGVERARGETGGEIEHEIARVTEPVLDVVAEDPEVPHVADDVEPAAVQEHRREQRAERRHECGRAREPADESGRGQRVLRGEVPQVRSQQQLVDEHREVDDDQQDRHHRCRARGVLVAERDQAETLSDKV